jgi:transposase
VVEEGDDPGLGVGLQVALEPEELGAPRGPERAGQQWEDDFEGTLERLGDMGYDADWVREELLVRGILPVIPPNPVRKEAPSLDRELYRLRNRVERLVNRLKQSRAVATRYDKTAESFLAFVQLAASRLWLRFVHTA